MQRQYKAYLKDILEAASKIERYTKGLSYTEFLKDSLRKDGVVRNLEVIGEAAKNIPPEIKTKSPEIEWKEIIGFRDVLIHAYFGVDFEIVWDVVKNKLPDLRDSIQKIIK